MMTNNPALDGSSNEIPAPLFSDEQLKEYLNLGQTVSVPPSRSPTNTFASDSEGVVENLLENGEEIMKDLVFKKIFDSYLKPRDFPGEKKLDIKLPNRSDSKYAYSSVLDKLYVQKNSAVNFSVTYERPSSPRARYSLLASVIFTNPLYAALPVKVCPNHRDSSLGNLADHFLKIECSTKETRYFTAQNDINMLQIENLPNISQTNRQESPLRLIFTDLNSCIGGINRRDVCVVFCLEESDEQSKMTNIVSTKVLNVKVCENAKRDMKTHERQRKTKPPRIVVESSNTVSVPLSEGGKKEQYWVLATNKRNYDAMLKVGAVMEENAGGDVEVWRKEVDTFNKKKIRVDLDNTDA